MVAAERRSPLGSSLGHRVTNGVYSRRSDSALRVGLRRAAFVGLQIQPDGSLTTTALLLRAHSDAATRSASDGMAVDAEGRVYIPPRLACRSSIRSAMPAIIPAPQRMRCRMSIRWPELRRDVCHQRRQGLQRKTKVKGVCHGVRRSNQRRRGSSRFGERWANCCAVPTTYSLYPKLCSRGAAYDNDVLALHSGINPNARHWSVARSEKMGEMIRYAISGSDGLVRRCLSHALAASAAAQSVSGTILAQSRTPPVRWWPMRKSRSSTRAPGSPGS